MDRNEWEGLLESYRLLICELMLPPEGDSMIDFRLRALEFTKETQKEQETAETLFPGCGVLHEGTDDAVHDFLKWTER